MIKKALRSKTILFALALELAGVVQANAEELRAAIPPEYYGYFLIAVGVAIKILRFMTIEAVADK